MHKEVASQNLLWHVGCAYEELAYRRFNYPTIRGKYVGPIPVIQGQFLLILNNNQIHITLK